MSTDALQIKARHDWNSPLARRFLRSVHSMSAGMVSWYFGVPWRFVLIAIVFGTVLSVMAVVEIIEDNRKQELEHTEPQEQNPLPIFDGTFVDSPCPCCSPGWDVYE